MALHDLYTLAAVCRRGHTISSPSAVLPPPYRGAADMDGGATEVTCERCSAPYARTTSERFCPDCFGPLRRLRQRAELSQRELASHVGCRSATIRELELEQYHPALALAEAIARELGVEVLTAFPSLQITKSEARGLLRATGRTVARLCETGELPSTCDGHWHRVDYAAVLRLVAHREAIRTGWISFNAAANEHELEWWILRQLEEDGKLDVQIGDARGTRLVRRRQLEAVLGELRANRTRVRCPHCGKVVKIGRQAHARCLGPLGSRRYWVHADPEEREERWRRHGELVSVRLAPAAQGRTVAAAVTWYRNRWRRSPGRPLVGRWSQRRGGGKPAQALKDPQWTQLALEIGRIRSENDKVGERYLATRIGRSRRQVRQMLAWLETQAA